MTLPIEPYRPRRIEPLGVAERANWTIKVIGITASTDLPDDAEIAAALEIAERELPHEWNPGPADPDERDFRTPPGSRPDDSSVAMWKSSGRAGAQHVDRPAGRPAIGFCIVHRGAEALWVLVCWWDLDIMYERLWRADLGSTDLRPVPPDGPTACVWELQAIGHERQAWIDHVLTTPSTPDYAGYLATTLTVAGPTP